ncbi:MAG: hypothetical protein RL139_1277 [Gemmatimonadota bacterium]|jgi:hypothetical protein
MTDIDAFWRAFWITAGVIAGLSWTVFFSLVIAAITTGILAAIRGPR